jgi:lipopolysaccharide biosynthesis glycosyltransferase
MKIFTSIFNLFLISSCLVFVSSSFLKYDKNEKYIIDKSNSLIENAEKIFKQKKYINFNKLFRSYNNLSPQDLDKFNNIHITICFNEEYHLLASVTIASILKNSNSNTYTHFHIIALNNLPGKIMEKIFSLREKINKNSEFIFYDGERVEKDFKEGAKKSERGIIDYGRLLIPEVIDDDIKRVISLDIGNIIVEKDLYDLYTKNLTYLAYLGVKDAYAKCFMESIFNHKIDYVNAAVLLLNIEKFKEIKIYDYMVKMYNYILGKTKFYNPYSDIINDFLPWRCNGYLPLEYNMPEFVKLREGFQGDYNIWRKKCSYYFNQKDIVIQAENNIVIRNFENYPVYKGKGNNYIKSEWLKYAELTGFIDEIKKKYYFR